MIQASPPASEDAMRPVREAVRAIFGFEAFREGQERAIGAILAGRDALVIMPTGSGKSLCYQAPALVLPGVTLVVSPLIALMKDQVDALARRGVPAAVINSSLELDEQWERLRELERGAYRVVYIAPERFRSRGFRSALAGARVSLLAIDEAHCISEWGHDFRPDYRRLGPVRAQVGGVPILALTATATPEVQEDIARELGLEDYEKIVTGFDRPNLALRVEKLRGEAAKMQRVGTLIREAMKGGRRSDPPSGIIYAATRRRAEKIAAYLDEEIRRAAAGPRGGGAAAASPVVERPLCAAYHAGLERERRRGIQEDFMSGRLPWVAATNAFGMGLDKADVRFVVHWDMPGSLEAFYQEVGRAGRDGLPAMCLLLFSEGDRRLQEFFIEGSNPRRDTIEAVHDSLFELRENPIFRTIAELERMFLDDPRRSRSNPLTIRSSVIVLERAGALQRLDHAENLAEVAPLVPLPWPEDRYPERARVKRAVHAALGRVFARTEGEPATIRLEHWARDLGIPEESLRRALGELAEDWVVRYVPPFRGSAILLPAVREPLQVDWQALERRRARDVERLETLIRFARSRACRRNLILRHFGEEVPPSGCGTCDPCVLRGRAGPARPQAPFVEAAATLVRKALSGVARARGRCGKRLVAQMLQGSRARRVGQMGLDRLSTHGILRELERDQILELLDILAGEGLIESSGGRLPRIWLSQRGVRVMKGEETLAIEALSPFFAGAGTRAYRARQAPTRPRARQVPPGGGA